MKNRIVKYNLNVDISSLQQDAVESFHSGFTCSESVVYAMRKHFELDLSDDGIAMSSCFPWGLGGGGCICGALAGGVMMLGYFFGRTVPGDPRLQQSLKVSQELHDYFCETCGASCCRVLTRGMEKGDPKRKAQCTRFVENTVKKTAEIIIREYQITN